MPTLNIKDPEVYTLATELAHRTGQTLTAAVKQALQEKLAHQPWSERERRPRVERVLERARELAALPVLDSRTPDEILGYDENGLWS